MTPQRSIQASFLLSANSLEACPQDSVPEVALVGRSNSGKSSTLNPLTGNRKLARVSKTPGRTQSLNFFVAQDAGRLVDLPGYGYAKAQRTLQQDWSSVASQYLETRSNLVGLIIVVDARRMLTAMDVHMLEWTIDRDLRTLLLLNKADKLKHSVKLKTFREVEAQMKDQHLVSSLLFSAVSDVGNVEASQWILGAFSRGID